MKILLNNNDLNKTLKKYNNIGFVPTMGSIHNGHISLINKSKKQCSSTIVSIFVNPMQFDKKSDFKNYPRNIKKDLAVLKKLKIDFVYTPTIKNIYNFKRKKKIKLKKNQYILCAKYRKGHFEGVLDVMDRLTRLIKPKNIYMGEKDYQQFFLVNEFLKKKYKIKIICSKTVRENNKLALSSRNLMLDRKSFLKAGKITENLMKFKKTLRNKKKISYLLTKKKKILEKFFQIKIEYLELRKMNNLKTSKKITKSKLFLAYHLNNVRLIDNF